MKAFFSFLGGGRIAALVCCGVLAVAALFLKFAVPGYSFSALVCLCLIGIILFYALFPLVGLKFPAFAKAVQTAVTVILAVGVLVIGITEGVIIHASFGNPEEPVDYVVVLGAKVNLDEHPDVTAVLSGGQGTDEPITEAECMYRELVNLGIDPERLWMEENATSTWENLNFALDLIEEKTGERPRKLGVVSSEYHLYRASRFAKACGVEFVGIPAKTSRLSQKINHFMREVAGVWHYILLGGNYD